MKIDEKHVSEVTRRVMSDGQRYPCRIRIADAWLLHGALDLARKHPGLHRPLKQELRQIMLLFRASVVERYPQTIKAFDHAGSMKQDEFLALAEASMADEAPITVELSMRQTWLLVSGVQAALRHPQMPSRETYTQLGRVFQQQVATVHPDAWAVLERGWHAEYDVN